MKVLVACEFSGIVRDSFAAKGHDAWSCDLLPSERPGNHIQGSVIDHEVMARGWDMLIAFPDCTFLTVSANAWAGADWRMKARRWAVAFVETLWEMPIPRIAIENPKGVLTSIWKPKSQVIQPWQFGHGETKETWLWLKNLPCLTPTNIVEGRNGRVWKESPGPNRRKNRSRTLQGIADAMAEQWSVLTLTESNAQRGEE